MLFVFSARVVYSCSCDVPKKPMDALKSTDAVFIGKVIKIEAVDDGVLGVTFEISKAFKGVSKKWILIQTGVGGPDCSFHFEEGEQYIVYASHYSWKTFEPSDSFSVSSCSRTTILSEASEDLKVFEKSLKLKKLF